MSAVESIEHIPLVELDTRFSHLRIPQPRLERAMVSSMKRYGQLSPLVGMRCGDAVAVVDGFKRMHAAAELEQQELVVRVLPLRVQAAVAAMYGLNRGSRGLVDLEEAYIVRELVREHGLTQPEVGELLERHKSWVSRRLGLAERLDPQVQADVGVGLVSVTVARELVRLPRGNQPEVGAAVHRNALTTRDAAVLVTLFEGTVDRAQQQQLLNDPKTYIDAHRGGPATPPHDPRLGVRANRLRRQAAQTTEALARLQRMLQELPIAKLVVVERQVRGPAWRQVSRRAGQTLAASLNAANALDKADA